MADRWEEHGATLLTCEDLSSAGWRHLPSDREASRAVVSGQIVKEADIRGVLMRRPWVFQQELTQIAAADREYVAAEMTAFLQSWLSDLLCPVLNRPRGTCLCGPNWRPQQWAQAAERAGLRSEAMHWRVPERQKKTPGDAAAVPAQSVRLTVVGDRCLGAPDESCAAGARRLAALAGTGLLTVRVSAGRRIPCFMAADPIPSLDDAEVADAVCDYLLAGVPRSGSA